MLHLPLSVGSILSAIKAIVSPLEKLLFFRAYEISTLAHSYRQLLGRFPHNLSGDLEYDVHMKEYYLRKQISCPLFWIRARNGKTFSKVVLSVTACNSKLRYQDTLTFFDVGSVPIQASLPSIPVRNVRVEENRVFSPYDSVETKVIELRDQDGQPINCFGESSALHPIDRLEVAMGLEKGDVEKWGEIFNLEFIGSEIREEQIRLIGSRFNSPKPIYAINALIFNQRWVIKINFWRKNLIFATQLTTAFEEFWRQQQEIDKFRIETGKERGVVISQMTGIVHPSFQSNAETKT